MSRPAYTWTDDRIDTMLDLLSQRMTTTEIGRAMGLSRSSVSGQIHRMRRTAPERLAAANYADMQARKASFNGGIVLKQSTARLMDELAYFLSEGQSIQRAAVNMGISPHRAAVLFGRMCKRLGWQAV